MWSIANLKENLHKIALDVHQDDDEDLSIYSSRDRDDQSLSDRRISHNFEHSNSSLRSPIANGYDSTFNSEIEQYRTEIRKLQESEAEIKALSINYAALLREKEFVVNHTMNQMNPTNPMLAMNPAPFASAQPQPWFPFLPPLPPPSSTFWEATNVNDRLKQVLDTIDLAKATQKELEMLIMMKDRDGSVEDAEGRSADASFHRFSKFVEDNRINMASQELLSLEAANAIISKLRVQLEPFRIVTDETSPWEEKSAIAKLAQKRQKHKRNKLWRKRKRKCTAVRLAKEREQFDQADKEADEWRAREIAKDIAKSKVEKMKGIAELKAKEEKKRLESELELILIVEKLQELRSIRIQKLKKQGHFLPEEDDKFLERVRAAVEEEERQAIAAADTDAAKDAITTAEESRKTIQRGETDLENSSSNKAEDKENQEQMSESDKNRGRITNRESGKQGSEGPGAGGVFDSFASLPLEFFHYYHGSNHDMGTLIEVRRTWDAYIRPGGSRIPGHWVQPPPPADEIWASYLVKPK